jgi:hypothetical protein
MYERASLNAHALFGHTISSSEAYFVVMYEQGCCCSCYWLPSAVRSAALLLPFDKGFGHRLIGFMEY